MINPFNIIQSVEQAYHLRPGSIIKRKKTKTVSEARSVAMYLTRKLTSYSLVEIAEHFDREDHATVAYNCKKVVKIVQLGCKTHAYNTTMRLIDEFMEQYNEA